MLIIQYFYVIFIFQIRKLKEDKKEWEKVTRQAQKLSKGLDKVIETKTDEFYIAKVTKK